MDFEQKLFDKFPELFAKKEDGTMYVPCGTYCPVGWEQIVEDVLGTVRGYVKYSNDSVEDNVAFYKVYKAVWIPIYNFLYRLVNPEKVSLKHRFVRNKLPTMKFRSFTKEQIEAERLLLGNRIREKLKKFDTWIKGGRYPFKSVPIRPVQIDQIKEKFGGLRIYYSGGDARVSGMIIFAESLARKTCMFTGERGASLYKDGGWIVTASEARAKEFGLIKYNE